MFRIKILEDAVVFLLEKIADAVGHLGVPGKFGIAIIIITILMRIVVFPLTLKQEKSMKKMRELQPEMDKIKEKYKDNPQEYQKRVSEIYKENNVNPLGGCLPLLIQLPVFVATFLWFNLKQPDKLFMMGNFAFNLLPILNTGVTYLQQKMMSGATQGQEGSNQLQSMMYTMPLMMLFLFYRMPSGVTLYYLVSGVLSLAQQYIIMKGRSDDGKDSIKS